MTPTPPDQKSAETPLQQIDTAKRYDIYCAEMGQRIVVYRNAKFKCVQRLLSAQKFDVMSDFYELELASGQSVFVSRHSLIKFCEQGVQADSEIVSMK